MSERISPSPSSSQSPTHVFLQSESNMQQALQDRDQTIQSLQSELLRYRLQELGGGELVLDFSGMTTPPDIENAGRMLKTKRETRKGKHTKRQIREISNQPEASASTNLLSGSRLLTNYQATNPNSQYQREGDSVEHHQNRFLNPADIKFLQKLLKVPLSAEEIQLLVQNKPNIDHVLNEIRSVEDCKVVFIIGYALSGAGMILDIFSAPSSDTIGTFFFIFGCCSFAILGCIVGASKMDEKREKLMNRLRYDGLPV